MDEKPKSIWKKSWAGWRAFLLLVTLLAFAGFLAALVSGLFHFYGAGIFDLAFFVNWLAFTIGAAMAFLVLVGLFYSIRWLCCWKNFRQFLFGLACIATLDALFYAEENWRGKHDWLQYKRDLEAKGEKLDFAGFIPPPVPDDQNFAMAPVFDATRNLASRKWRNEHRNQHPDSRGNPWDTNLVDRLQIDLSRSEDWAVTRSADSGSGDWQMAKASDLKTWQNYYRALAATTNLFPVTPQPQTPAQDVLLALGKYASVIEELRAAGARPDSRFPLDYDDEDPAEILLPHLAALKRSSQVLQLRALAELENNQPEKSLDDIKLSLRLADSVRTEPFIITHLVRIAILQITLQPVWEGLAQHKWSDAQLAELDSELVKLDFLADYKLSVRGERAAHVKIIDWLEQNRSRYWQFLDMLENDAHRQDDVVKNFVATSAFYLMPKGWFYQNEVVLAQLEQQWSLSGVDDATQTISPKKTAQADEAVKSISHARPFNLFACVLLPALGNFAQRTAYSQNAVNLARTAIALARYHLAHGEFPDALDTLAPQFLEKIPHDVIGGQPLKYSRTADGQFVLYSVGWNETDDGGVVAYKKDSPSDESSSDVDINQGDWVWRYPKKE